MLAGAEIEDSRLSFVWADTGLTSFAGRICSEFNFLGVDYEYERKFKEAVRNRNGGEVDLEPPWPDSRFPQHFWTYYLDGREALGEISGRDAYKALIPFRGSVPAIVTIPDELQICRHTLEVFYYPHGLALVITAYIIAPRDGTRLPVSRAINIAGQLRSTRNLGFEWKGKVVPETLSLGEVARRCLTNLREDTFGPGTLDTRTDTPFSIYTVVKGGGVHPNVEPSLGIYQELQAVTTWRRTSGGSVDEFKNYSLTKRTPAAKGDVLFGQERGRAVWFPYLFTQSAGTLHSLACYHRNLVLASLQVESLGLLISRTAKQREDGQEFHSPDHRECVRRAADILGRLYEGSYSTYRSWSTRVQIEEDDLMEDLEEIRGFFDMSPLGPPPSS